MVTHRRTVAQLPNPHHRSLAGLSDRDISGLLLMAKDIIEQLARSDVPDAEFTKAALLLDGINPVRLRDELLTRRAEKMVACR